MKGVCVKKEKLPEFLIVGAAKSGTTSLYNYLKVHPDIYLPEAKEPRFLTSQFVKLPFKSPDAAYFEQEFVKTFDQYKKLFSETNEGAIIGEASPDTLYYYENSIKIIKKYLGAPKIIIILRNPIERAYSAYTYLVRDNRETLTFRTALGMESERIKENWEFMWLLKDVGLYYNQVKAFKENFKNVRIYLSEDLKSDPQGLLKDIFEFLGADSDFIPDNLKVIYNVSGVPKNKLLHKFLHDKLIIKSLIKPFIPFLLREKIVKNLKNKNLIKIAMKDEDKNYLREFYREDIKKLENLIDRDLSHWLK